MTTKKAPVKKIHKIVNKVPCLGGNKITITQVTNGYQVQVGCRNFVINDAVTLCDTLLDYLQRPRDYEKALEDDDTEEDQPVPGTANSNVDTVRGAHWPAQYMDYPRPTATGIFALVDESIRKHLSTSSWVIGSDA